MPIGIASFEGTYENENNVKAQARRIGATAVAVAIKGMTTHTSTTPLFLPTSSTTYHSGTVSGGGTYGTYGGTSTTYGTTVVPVTRQQNRYGQEALFFVKLTNKLKFGFYLASLTDEQRRNAQRNTGAIIDIVIEETPAFYANVIPGDILIKINESFVLNESHAVELMNHISPSASNAELTVIRNGIEQSIKIVFDKI